MEIIREAKPIWNGITGKNRYIEAKQEFILADGEERISALLQICADTEYVVFLNGNYVGFGQYRVFRGKKVYDEYEVSSFLKEGDNELRIAAYCEGEDAQTYQADIPVVVFALSCGSLLVLSGKNTLVRNHPFYKSGDLEKITPQLGYTFYYNASKEETEWEKAKVWDNENFYGRNRPIRYEKRPVKKLVMEELVQGKLMTQGLLYRMGDGTFAEIMQSDGLLFCSREAIFEGNKSKARPGGIFLVIDLEREEAGLFFMEVTAPKGTVMDIGWGEHLEDLRVRTRIGNRNFAGRYVCREGHQEFTGYFRRLGCRYLQIHVANMTGDVMFHRIGLIPTNYPLDRKAFFACDNFLLNRLVKVAEHTLTLCMHEHYEDCPWREQALYAFDSYVQMLCGYYLFGEYEFARASLKLLAESQRKDGMLLMCAPSGITMAIPSFALVWVMSVEKYVLYSADVEFGRLMVPVAERLFSAFQVKNDLVQNDKGEDPSLENWHFYEWSDGLDGYNNMEQTEEDSIINFYYIMACEAYRKLCSYLGIEDSRPYHDPDRIRNAVREKYFDAESGLYQTRADSLQYHELTQALAVLSETAKDQDTVLDRLLQKDNGMVRITLSTSLFKYEALLSRGERFRESVLEQIDEIWGKMLYAGAGTLWEVEEGAGAFSGAGSLCHGWSAVPVYLLYKYYLGYEPLEPGFKKYKLTLHKTKYLSYAKAMLYTPQWGKIVELGAEKD